MNNLFDDLDKHSDDPYKNIDLFEALKVLKGFHTIVIDPPWETTTGPQFGYEDSGHNNLAYGTMTMQEIRDLPVSSIAATEAHLYLWVTNILVPEAYKLVSHWGFKPSVLLTWAKNPIGGGLGDAFGITTEHILFAHRGGLRPKCRVPSTWWNWTRGKHSEKPEDFQTIVEKVSTGPYLEMFARRQRPGWVCWGNELAGE